MAKSCTGVNSGDVFHLEANMMHVSLNSLSPQSSPPPCSAPFLPPPCSAPFLPPPPPPHFSDPLQEDDCRCGSCLPGIPMTSGTSTNSTLGSKTGEFPSGLMSTACSDTVKQEPIYNCECTSFSRHISSSHSSSSHISSHTSFSHTSSHSSSHSSSQLFTPA